MLKHSFIVQFTILAAALMLFETAASAQSIVDLVAAEFEKAGMQSAKGEVEQRKSALAANRARVFSSRKQAMPSALTVSPSTTVVGVMVRFRDPEVQRRAERGFPPPPELIRSIEVAVGHPVRYYRPMSGGVHVFKFDVPITIEAGEALLPSLRSNEAVEVADLDTTFTSHQSASSDPFVRYQWNMKGRRDGFPGGIDAAATWPITFGTGYPVVAVVDTGILPHPDLAGRLLPGYDFVSDPASANDGSGRDGDAEDPGNWAAAGECGSGTPARSSNWHGTHVAGIVAADGSNGFGVAGVSWRTRILPVRVLGKCRSNVSDILDGIQWASGLPVPGVPKNANPAHIINLSLGGHVPDGCPWLIQESLNRALGQGALIVVSAGNNSDDAARYAPANCKGVLTVFATDHLGFEASYTNFDLKGIGISAPGGDSRWYGRGFGIWSTVATGTTVRGDPTIEEMDGTSMAAPHVGACQGSCRLIHAASGCLSV